MLINCLKSRRKILFYGVALSVITCVTMLHLFSDLPVSVQDNNCYKDTINDALPLIQGDFDSPRKSIHFHETSCEGRLDSRQACAVESAALAHPHWQINMLFAGPVTKENFEKSLKPLTYYKNIKLFRINVIEYAKATPLYTLFKEVLYNNAFQNRTRVMYDALKYLTLYKWGGVHLDLDMIVARSFDELGLDWVAEQYENSVGTGALAFSKMLTGRKIAALALRDFKINIKDWANMSPNIVTNVLRRSCKGYDINKTLTKNCGGFHVYRSKLFYPIPYSNHTEVTSPEHFESGDQKPYTYNIGTFMGSDMQVVNGSLIARLAQMYCRKVYEHYGDKFGLGFAKDIE